MQPDAEAALAALLEQAFADNIMLQAWSSRLLEGAGVRLSRLEPLGRLKAETARSGSIDVGYAADGLEATLTLIASTIDNAVWIVPVAA